MSWHNGRKDKKLHFLCPTKACPTNPRETTDPRWRDWTLPQTTTGWWASKSLLGKCTLHTSHVRWCRRGAGECESESVCNANMCARTATRSTWENYQCWYNPHDSTLTTATAVTQPISALLSGLKGEGVVPALINRCATLASTVICENH